MAQFGLLQHLLAIHSSQRQTRGIVTVPLDLIPSALNKLLISHWIATYGYKGP